MIFSFAYLLVGRVAILFKPKRFRIFLLLSLFSNYPDFKIFEISCSNTVGACVQPGLYAMVGAAAALGGVTRMTGMYVRYHH